MLALSVSLPRDLLTYMTLSLGDVALKNSSEMLEPHSGVSNLNIFREELSNPSRVLIIVPYILTCRRSYRCVDFVTVY
jgi:hypothetical protein